MGSARAYQGMIWCAAVTMGICSMSGCRTNAEPNTGAATGTSPPAAAPQTASPAPAGSSEPGAPVLATALSQDRGILSSTKRSTQGLPEPLPDYLSWVPVSDSADASKESASPHFAFRKTYVYFPKGYQDDKSLPRDAILLLEEKEPGRDYIGRVSSMTKGESGWSFSTYVRNATTEPFSERESSQCASCHSPAAEEKIIPRIVSK